MTLVARSALYFTYRNRFRSVVVFSLLFVCIVSV